MTTLGLISIDLPVIGAPRSNDRGALFLVCIKLVMRMLERGDRMALKYRIKYDTYSKYNERKPCRCLWTYLIVCFVLSSLCLLMAYTPSASFLYELILPGDPAVTVEAFQQMSKALDSGADLSDVLDVFCVTVMDAR